MSKTLSPPTSPAQMPPRVSVPVTPEVLAVFQRLAKAGSMSTGRAMADWLADTVEAAEFMAEKMEQARAAPKLVMAEMHAYALGLADETGDLLRRVREKGKADKGRASGQANAGTGARALAAAKVPPSCNTGGKVPAGKSSPRGGKSS